MQACACSCVSCTEETDKSLASRIASCKGERERKREGRDSRAGRRQNLGWAARVSIPLLPISPQDETPSFPAREAHKSRVPVSQLRVDTGYYRIVQWSR